MNKADQEILDILKETFRRKSKDELIDPDNAMAIERIGRYYQRTDKPDKALQYVLKALELNPNNFQINYTLATIYCRQKRDLKKGFYYL